MGLSSNLIGALTSQPVRWVNFEHSGRQISPIGFYLLAKMVSDGKIKTKVDRNIEGRIAYYDPDANTIIASSSDFGGSYWDEKALLIHEGAHAILDAIYAGKNMSGQKSAMKVVDDEVCGYLAGAFYLVSAKADGPSQVPAEREALKLAKSKLSGAPAWTGTLTFRFTATELTPLKNAIRNSPEYKAEANNTALHNG